MLWHIIRLLNFSKNRLLNDAYQKETEREWVCVCLCVCARACVCINSEWSHVYWSPSAALLNRVSNVYSFGVFERIRVLIPTRKLGFLSYVSGVLISAHCAFAKFRKATINSIVSVRPSVCSHEQLGSHCIDFDENLVFELFFFWR